MESFETATAASINGLKEYQKEDFVGIQEPVDKVPFLLYPGFQYHVQNSKKKADETKPPFKTNSYSSKRNSRPPPMEGSHRELLTGGRVTAMKMVL